jgi:hypothetical protein
MKNRHDSELTKIVVMVAALVVVVAHSADYVEHPPTIMDK